jgi:hypothetical protein
MTGAKKILAWATGFRGRAKSCISIARERVEKGLQYAYRDRKARKADFRSLWIQRINAGAREHGVRHGGGARSVARPRQSRPRSAHMCRAALTRRRLRCAPARRACAAPAAQVLAADTRPGGGEHQPEPQGAVGAGAARACDVQGAGAASLGCAHARAR